MITTTQFEKIEEATLTIDDDSTYVINPLVRMRNEHDGVYICRYDEGGYNRTHHIFGVTFALCNGERSVKDIGKILAPLLRKEGNSRDPDRDALLFTKLIISKNTEEYKGLDDTKDIKVYLEKANSLLVPSYLNAGFGRLRSPVYNPKDFLPENAYEKNGYDSLIKLRAPMRINWHVTSECPADCLYCYLGRRNIPRSKILSKKRMFELIRECKQIGIPSIDPSGGDLLLYQHLFDLLDALEDGEFLPFMVSTKALVTKQTAKRLSQYSTICETQVSVDSPIEEVADYLTKTKGYYKRALKSIGNLLEAGFQVNVKAVVTPYNILTIPRLCRELYRAGISNLLVHPYHRSDYHHTDDLFNHKESYAWLEETLKDKYPKEWLTVHENPIQTTPSSDKSMEDWLANETKCSAGRSSMMICADGKVIPCERIPETEEFFCGDVSTQSIKQVWESDKLNSMYVFFEHEMFRDSPCYDCDHFHDCIYKKGFCFRNNYLHLGKMYTTPENCPEYTGPFIREV